VALSWVHAKPGVTSIIIGARRLSQFEENIRALDVTLTAEELARLDAITEPTLGFPQSMLPMAASMTNGGTTINGVSAPVSEFVLPEGHQPY
jgi:diketogulonate reductase-like aldo/keto reductase